LERLETGLALGRDDQLQLAVVHLPQAALAGHALVEVARGVLVEAELLVGDVDGGKRAHATLPASIALAKLLGAIPDLIGDEAEKHGQLVAADFLEIWDCRDQVVEPFECKNCEIQPINRLHVVWHASSPRSTRRLVAGRTRVGRPHGNGKPFGFPRRPTRAFHDGLPNPAPPFSRSNMTLGMICC
jgi:hypothetical protein